MAKNIQIKTVKDYNDFNNNATLHPLVSVCDLSKSQPRKDYKVSFDVYCVVMKKTICGDLKYGNNTYDYQEGTLVFFAPGQVVENTNVDEFYQPLGTALVFHPDFLLGTALAKKIQDYGFFSYNTSEALHLSEKEKGMVLEIFDKIEEELQQNIDKHSKTLITSNIDLLLSYCTRYYDRQFITRDHVNKGTLEKFEALLNEYYSSEKPLKLGLASVSYCAEQLNLSPNYFGDLIKKETGKTAQEFIQNKVISIGKERIFDLDKSISEVAYDLGFKYPQHFTRLFKQKVGVSPNEFRNLN